MPKKNLTVAVLGYGSQGRAMALNLRDADVPVIVGLREDSPTHDTVRRENIASMALEDAANAAEVIIIALPDHVHGQALNDDFFRQMTGKPSLVFLHGSSIHFGLVAPPKKLPVLLLAPHAPGVAVRENFISGEPYSAFYGIYSGPKKAGADLLKWLAGKVGIPESHLIKTTFEHEAVGDLFGEQAVLCGGLARMLKLGYETLVDGGLSPQNAYLEVCYQLDLIVDLVKKYGLSGMFDRISPLARYGAMRNGHKIIPDSVGKNMAKILAEIESGKFIQIAAKDDMKSSAEAKNRVTNSTFDKQARKFSKA